MLKSMKLPLMAGALAIPLALLSGGAQAQVATYCGGGVTGDGVYASPSSDGNTLLIIYVMNLQNRRQTTIPSVNVTVNYVPGVEPISGSPLRLIGLRPGQQVTVQLGKQSFYNPSGEAPQQSRTDILNRIRQATTVTCGPP